MPTAVNLVFSMANLLDHLGVQPLDFLVSPHEVFVRLQQQLTELDLALDHIVEPCPQGVEVFRLFSDGQPERLQL
jgi:hypothetical protein